MRRTVKAYGIVNWRGEICIGITQKQYEVYSVHKSRREAKAETVYDDERVVPVTIHYDDGQPAPRRAKRRKVR